MPVLAASRVALLAKSFSRVHWLRSGVGVPHDPSSPTGSCGRLTRAVIVKAGLGLHMQAFNRLKRLWL